MLGFKALVLGKETFQIKKLLHEKFQSNDSCFVDNGLLYAIVVTWMGKPSAGKHSSMNIKFILGLIHLSIYCLFSFLPSFLPFLSFPFSSFLPLFLSFCPFHLHIDCFLLAGFDNYYAYCKGCFPSISTVWNNGHFILGREGYGQPSPGGQPISRAQMKESTFRLVRAAGAARQEGFLLMCLNFPKGGCYAVASGLFPRAQCAEVSLYTAALPCAFSPMWDVAACRKTFPPLLLVAVLSFRKKGQFLKERQKPLSLFLSPSLPLALSPFLYLSLSLHHFTPVEIHFTSDRRSTVANVHWWLYLSDFSTGLCMGAVTS